MNKLHIPSRQRGLHFSAVLILLLTTLAPTVTPVHAMAVPRTNAISSSFAGALPNWWQASLLSPVNGTSAAGPYQTLPTWLPPMGAVAAPSPRPLADSIQEVQIQDAFGTEVVTKTLTAGESFTFYAVGYDGPISSTQEVTWTLSHEIGSLSAINGTSTAFQAHTAGSATLKATLISTPTISNTAQITVVLGNVHHFDLVAPLSATAGSGFMLAVTAKNSYNYTVTNFSQAVTLSVDAGQITPNLISGSGFSGGVWGDVVTLTQAGRRVISATRETVSGTATMTVTAGDLTTMTIEPTLAQVTVGETQIFTATGTDAYGNAVPVAPTWTASGGDILSGPGATTVFTAQTSPAPATGVVTATQGSIIVTAPVTIQPGALDHFVFGAVSSPQTAGQAFGVTITAEDAYGNTATGYAGPATLTDTTGTINPTQAGGFTNGVWSGSVTITRTGSGVQITAEDGSASGASNGFVVEPGPLDHFVFGTVSSPQTAGQAFGVTITAEDAYGNTATGYAGPATLTDTTGTINPTQAGGFTDGVWSGDVTITRTGSGVQITAEDGSASGASNGFVVEPGALDEFVIGGLDDQVAGESFDLTIIAYDSWDNVKTNYAGQPDLSDTTGSIWPVSTDSGCFLPAGVCVQSVTISRARQDVRITVSDPGGVSEYSTLFDVSPAPLDHIRINSAADNNGQGYGYPVEVGDHVMDIYQTFDVWAAGYDQFDNFRGDLSVAWGLSGVLAAGEIVPSSGVSAIFTPAPVLSGTGAITANYVLSGLIDSTGVFTVQAPWLLISKYDNQDPVSAAGNLLYTIVYTNVGNAPARGVRITETFDSHVSFDGAVPSPNEGNNVWWPLPNGVLGVNASKTIYVFVDVAGSLSPGTVLTNVVDIGGPRIETHTFTETTVVTSTPALTVSLRDLNDPVDAGDSFNLQVTYVNSGTAPVNNIVLTLTLDPHLTYQSAGETPVIPPTAGTGNEGRWELGSLDGNGEDDFYVTVRVDGLMADQYPLINDAVIQSDETDPAYATEPTVVNAPVLALAKQATPSPVQAGSRLTLTLTYTNQGHADAVSVFLTDSVPNDTDFVNNSCVPGCERIGDVLRWDLDTLVDGETGTASFVVAVHDNLDDGTLLTNMAGLEAYHGYTATAALATEVRSAPVLTLTQRVNVEPVRVTDELIYTLAYTNVGNAPAYSVVLTDVIPDHVSLQSGCSPVDNCVRSDRLLTWTLGDVAASTGGQFTLHLLVEAPLADQTILANTAAISAAEETRAATLLTTTVIAPELDLLATDDPDPVQANALLTNRYVYYNDGEGYAASVILTATLPDHTTFQSCTPLPCGPISARVVSWDLGRLDGNTSDEAFLVVHVDNSLDNGTVLASDARLVASAELVSAEAGLIASVSSQPSVWIDLGDSRTAVEAGERIIYTLQYANDGNSNAYDTVIVATLPDLQLVNYQDCQPAAKCDRSGDQVTYQLGTVPGDGSDAVYLVVDVVDPLPAGIHTIAAAATISTITPGDPIADNDAEDVDSISTTPDLVVTADYEDIMPYPGKRVTYTVHYNNEGHIETGGVFIAATRSLYTIFEKDASESGWVSLGDGSYIYSVGDLDYTEGGDLLFVVTLTSTHFTTAMTNFDAVFEIYDDGRSGDDDDPSSNVEVAPLGVPNIVIEDVVVDASVWLGEPGFLTVTVRNTGGAPTCGVYGASGECTGFALDPFLDPSTPPASYPLEGYGDCFSFVDPIHPGLAETVVISFTLIPGLPGANSGFCRAGPLQEIWLKADNWDHRAPPYPAEFGLVPEYDEYDNVYGPIEPAYRVYLPVVVRNH